MEREKAHSHAKVTAAVAEAVAGQEGRKEVQMTKTTKRKLTKLIWNLPTALTRRCRATLSRSLLRQKRYGGQARGRGIFPLPSDGHGIRLRRGYDGTDSKRTPIVFWKKWGFQ